MVLLFYILGRFPDSRIPDMPPHFVGREKVCEEILNHLTTENAKVVAVRGPTGIGKTSVAIRVAHQLRNMKIPVFFLGCREVESKEEFVSKLLNLFIDTVKLALVTFPTHWLVQRLTQLQNPFVLILDGADELLESAQQEELLMFIDEILAQCSLVKLLFTTRPSPHILGLILPIHVVDVDTLGDVSSASLVRLLLPDVSEDDCKKIVAECRNLPLAIVMMCSLVRDRPVDVSVDDLVRGERFNLNRLKRVMEISFEGLVENERDAFVSLAVFPSYFQIEEATAVLSFKTVQETQDMIGRLVQRSLISVADYTDGSGRFEIHSHIRSFIEEKVKANHEIGAVYYAAQRHFYGYYIGSFAGITTKFYSGRAVDAVLAFIAQREKILLSLSNGTKDEELYPKAVEVLSMGDLFLYTVIADGKLLCDELYNTAMDEAKRRQNLVDERRLLSAKSFGNWGSFSLEGQTMNRTILAGYTLTADCPAKLLCHVGIHQVLSGNLDEGMSSLTFILDRLSNNGDEEVLKLLAFRVLGECYKRRGDLKKASHFGQLLSDKIMAKIKKDWILMLFFTRFYQSFFRNFYL